MGGRKAKGEAEVKVPDAAMPLILMQRTDLKSDVERGYSAMIADDFRAIEPWLPRVCASTLDLGCGVGGLSVLLWQEYGPNVKINLLDVDHVQPLVVYGHQQRPEAYNSMAAALDLLAVNGVPRGRVDAMLADERFIIPLPDASVGLVVSLLAWGYHWPVASYLPEVRRVLEPGGRVIFDLRRGQPLPGGLRVVGKRDYPKAERLCCEVAG